VGPDPFILSMQSPASFSSWIFLPDIGSSWTQSLDQPAAQVIPVSLSGHPFPHAGCTVTLVDLQIHRAEIIKVEGASYRLKEAKERKAAKTKSRTPKTTCQSDCC
jgi:hypothetical protein